MFNINSRQAPVITGNVTATVRGNRLLPNGVPVSASQVIALLQRNVYKDNAPTEATFTGGVSIRLAVFNADTGEHLGIVKKLSCSYQNSEGSTAVETSDEIAKYAIEGKDISVDLGYRFQIGIFDAEGNVDTRYDDREVKTEYEATEVADPLAAFTPTKSQPTVKTRTSIGFINIFAWDTKTEKYFRIGASQLGPDDAIEVSKVLAGAASKKVKFAPVVMPTAELQAWLDADKASTESEAESLFDFGF